LGKDSGFGGAGTLSINFIDNEIKALILNSTTTQDSTGAVTVHAKDDSGIYSFAGSFALGRSYGVGAAFAVNDIENSVTAEVDGSTWTTSGDFITKAEATGTIRTVSVGAGGGGKFAAGGAISFNEITNTLAARIKNNSDIDTIGTGEALPLPLL
ncbi:MAG: hypothetical protein ACYSQZ_07115, partial [Planctomycetota bacterium]